MKIQTLRDVLWTAQKGCCWICGGRMMKVSGHYVPQMATLDHLWPKSKFGTIGDLGVTLLAHGSCNAERANPMPSDDDIRLLVRTYRAIPRQWIQSEIRKAELEIRSRRASALRLGICEAIIGEAA
jgi:hypothetical protein